jgi:hypothetical protein
MWAASFKSLYPKRPAQKMQMRTVASRGAPDTALSEGPPRWGGYVTLKLCQSSMA